MDKDAPSQPPENPRVPNNHSLLKISMLAGLLGTGALAFNVAGIRDTAMAALSGSHEKAKAHTFQLGQYGFQIPLDIFTRRPFDLRKKFESSTKDFQAILEKPS